MTSYTATNAGYDQNVQNMDTELVDMRNFDGHDISRKKPFDWCILSVLGYICCPPIGLCAMYYAIRTNHGHDHNIEDYKIQNSLTKAKILTILSIVLGCLATLCMIILVVYLFTYLISSIPSMHDLSRMVNSVNDYTG